MPIQGQTRSALADKPPVAPEIESIADHQCFSAGEGEPEAGAPANGRYVHQAFVRVRTQDRLPAAHRGPGRGLQRHTLHPAEAAVTGCIPTESSAEVLLVKVGPEHVGDVQLGIADLP